MATVRNKSTRSSPAPPPNRDSGSEPWLIRFLDGVFRFLSSLKLAVILIASLASVLAFGTFYESTRGTQAVQLDIYQSKGFALLLAMLGVNILCAALIRFPWKKRQTGFVITHAGLLVLLLGSFLSIKTTDEGRVGLVEGDTTDQYVRIDRPVMRLEKLDPDTGAPTRRFTLGFNPGSQPWDTKELERLASDRGYVFSRTALKGGLGVLACAILAGVFVIGWRSRAWVAEPQGAIVQALSFAASLALGGLAWWFPIGPRSDVLSDPSDPFRLVVKDYLPSATQPLARHEPAADGVPMLRAALMIQPPRAEEATDALRGDGWLVAENELGRDVINLGVARLTFQYLHGPQAASALDDFLHPPPNPLIDRLARIHYHDRDGKPRVYEWLIKDEDSAELEDGGNSKPGKSIELPDSDLTVALVGVKALPTRDPSLLEGTGPQFVRLLAQMGDALRSESVNAAIFTVRRGTGREVPHIGWSDLPLAPSRPPLDADSSGELVSIGYFHPPRIDAGARAMQGRLGQIDVVMADDCSFHYRAFGRDGLKGAGPIRIGESVRIFGGENMPMQLALRLDELIPSGRVRMECEPLELPPSEQESMVPAALVALEVDETTRDIWLPRTQTLDSDFHLVEFPSGPWRISFDFDRRPLKFQVSLLDFDPSNDPGTSARSAFRSDVTVRPLGEAAPARLPFADLEIGAHYHFVDRPRETFVKTSAQGYETFDGDEALTIDDATVLVQPTPSPVKITMNNPMIRDSWTFYQSSYQPRRFQNGDLTGDFISFLSVRYDPAWPVVYGGCLLIVIGAFVQFYMRAGVFSDGGKKGRQRDDLRQQRKAKVARAHAMEENDVELEI